MKTPTDRILGLMEASGTSVKALAESSGIPRATLQRRLAFPDDFTLSEMDRLSEALGVTALYLLIGTPSDRSAS